MSLGFAIPHSPGPRLLPVSGQDSQKAHRLGASDHSPTASVAAQPSSGVGGRQQLRRLEFAPLLPIYASTRYHHHKVALGAALYDPPPTRQPAQNGRPRVKGKHLPPQGRRRRKLAHWVSIVGRKALSQLAPDGLFAGFIGRHVCRLTSAG